MLQLFETMLRIRTFEEKAAELFKSGIIKGTAHSYAGRRRSRPAPAFGSQRRLYRQLSSRPRPLHRQSARVDRMMAELMGRSTGYCGGWAARCISRISASTSSGRMDRGAAMPLGTGAALAAKLQGNGNIAVAFFGDGAANQGIFHEFAEPRVCLEAPDCVHLRE